MAAPTPTTRIAPPGYAMKDGFRSLITFAIDPNILLFEIASTPPAVDGGDPIETTNMWNGTWRTMRARQLKTLEPHTFRFNYHPLVRPQLEAIVNVETTVTMTFSTGNYVAYYGYLRRAEFNELVEGQDPEGTGTIVPTNFDPANLVEASPVTGTSS